MSYDYFTEIINPSDPSGPEVKAVIPHRLILRYYKYFPVRYENLRAAKYVLDHTKRILAGVRRYNEGGWCFTGRPSIWYTKENVEVGFPQDFVFAVYLNDRFVVYESRAEVAALDDVDCPKDWQTRFTGLVWKSTS